MTSNPTAPGPVDRDRRTDRDDIGAVLIRYATAIDTKDWKLLRTCFTADAQTDYGEIGRWADAAGLTEFMIAAHAGMASTKHMLTNMVVEPDGDLATATTYVHTIQVLTGERKDWIDGVGHYEDRLVRTRDGWRISRRTFRSTRLITSFD
ncbi:nuclear transport factor 2 family protein [Nocardia sp. alder85J]|uniref:nuclear transport factor 2 family protein n=1 Tax=Nocardia sp. alder85J TaxID=2862949 RepID=UPI001CD784E6|nr:nuclear transport factor 2 family protein [Nocardia sp. alder85J]MCX4091561.1 nuclear transport factor 2 family protein [Nocardia sp. alder85J]